MLDGRQTLAEMVVSEQAAKRDWLWEEDAERTEQGRPNGEMKRWRGVNYRGFSMDVKSCRGRDANRRTRMEKREPEERSEALSQWNVIRERYTTETHRAVVVPFLMNQPFQ